MLYSEQDSVKVADLVGLAEVCELIGYTDGHITHLLQNDPSFPRPLTSLKSGRIWDASKVKAWRQTYVPRPAGRPSTKPGEQSAEASAEDRKAKLDALLGGLA